MLVKILGALAIVVSCSMVGFELSSQLTKRVKILELWEEALRKMQSYIEYAKMPLYEIYENLAGDETAVAQFFKTLTERRGESTSKSWKKTLAQANYITKKDKEILQNLAGSLGVGDYETQLKDIDFTLKNIRGAIEQAQAISLRDAKLYRSISFFAGVTIAILLV